MSSTELTVTQEDLEKDLRSAGIRGGDILVVHSSLRQVGWIEGGAEAMLSALTNVLTPKGTLVMPTFTFNLAAWNLPPFEPWKTPSRVGSLTDSFWRRPGVRRTSHPTHSVAAWGRYAARLTFGNLDYEPLGIGSPLDRARELGARILLVGVGQNRNSTVHVAEALADMPYFQVGFVEGKQGDKAWFQDKRHRKPVLVPIKQMPGSSEGFDVLDEMLVQKGVAEKVRIGAAPSTIMNSQELCDAVVDALRQDPCLFFRSENPSEISLRRRRFMERLHNARQRGDRRIT